MNITVKGNPGSFVYAPAYVNVKTHTERWIDECASRGLLESGLADVFTTQHMTYAAENLFNVTYKARGFTMLRHPVKRVVDQFYYQQHATWENSWDVEQATMSLKEFSTSDKMIENFVVRSLVGLDSTMTVLPEHVHLASDILRRKFVVGIFEWFDKSIMRFEKYFGWWEVHDILANMTVNNCHFKATRWSDHVGNHPRVPKGEDTYSIIMTRNWADVELYHEAKTLFAEQSKLLGMSPLESRVDIDYRSW